MKKQMGLQNPRLEQKLERNLTKLVPDTFGKDLCSSDFRLDGVCVCVHDTHAPLLSLG